jgi:alpha,alpha-trehalase
MTFNHRILVAVLIILSSCQTQPARENIDFYSTDLFKDVQSQAIFPDSKYFVDCTAKKSLTEIVNLYESQKSLPDFDLRQFVSNNFDLPYRPQSNFSSDTARSMEEHITQLWQVLQRNPDKHNSNASLIPLPHPYIVPGGRFSEIYYWDSYFTMLGLQTQGRYDIIENMVNNFSFLIDSLGFIPNGNRNYYLGRSQPPFFSLMVKLVAEKDSSAIVYYLPQLQKEYAFWMRGSDKLQKEGDAFEHVVKMTDGIILNRYFDKIALPRPEAYKEDVKLSEISKQDKPSLYTNLRAAAESGLDFSSRWLIEGEGLESIRTTDLIPVDLNALLYHLERTIARGLELKGEKENADNYNNAAEARKKALLKFCWDARNQYFYDYDFRNKKLSTVKTLAAAYPLFFEIAEPNQATAVAKIIETEFLKPGGLTTTLNKSGEQWDAPNGWAPLQWMSYRGLKNYHFNKLAGEIKTRWLKTNKRVYKATGKMMEKYNVMDTTLVGGGGEYPNQDGFGWTNGVAIKFMKE